MPLDRFVLILVAVVAAAGATVLVAAILLSLVELPLAGLLALAALLPVAYVAWRVVADRVRSREDSHYDRIRK